MNEHTTPTTESALMLLPDHDQLPALFQRGEIDAILERIEREALSIAPDLTTAKGRKEIASLAHKVARSKTALDAAGKDLTDEARKQIDAVNGERKKVRERLDELKAKVRKPLDDWEAAEETRKASHRARIQMFNTERVSWQSPASEIESVIAEIEAIEIGEDWEEFQGLASEAKAEALVKFRDDLKAARTREEQEKELAELREAKRRQEEKDREAERLKLEQEAADREKQEARDRQKRLAEGTIAYIKKVEAGEIGGQFHPFGVLIYELENKLVIDDRLGVHREAVQAVRDSAIAHLQEQMERQAEENERRAEQEREEAAELARRQAKEAAEKRKEEEERKRARREANKKHREKVKREIRGALDDLSLDDMPEAMIAGRIPHVRVDL